MFIGLGWPNEGDLATGWLHRAQNRRAQPSQFARPSRAPQTIEGCRVPGRRENASRAPDRDLKYLKRTDTNTLSNPFS